MNFTSESRFYNKNIHLYKYFPIKLPLKIVNGYTIKKNSSIPHYTNLFLFKFIKCSISISIKKNLIFYPFFNKISPDISLNII